MGIQVFDFPAPALRLVGYSFDIDIRKEAY